MNGDELEEIILLDIAEKLAVVSLYGVPGLDQVVVPLLKPFVGASERYCAISVPLKEEDLVPIKLEDVVDPY